MRILKNTEGTLTVVLTSADPEWMLDRLNENAIPLYRVRRTGELTVSFCCSGNNQRAVSELCRRYGSHVDFQKNRDLYWYTSSIFRHPVLTFGIAVLFVLTWYLPTRVLFLCVQGNERIPSGQVLDAARACGIQFGISGKTVRSERMKNALLEKIPDLQWAGINTSGCLATILVRERSPETEQSKTAGFKSIASIRDGYVTSCTVTGGTAACVPGQVVKAGQILISGYTDCGICIRAEDAQGEIFAETNHHFRTIIPSIATKRQKNRDTIRRYGIILGKKHINLWKDSGIFPSTCGRMYEEYYITLPGGFSLPLGFYRETITQWDCDRIPITPQEQEAEWKSFAKNCVLNQTVAGSILQESHALTQLDGVYQLDSSFHCSEMIGRVITQEIGDINGEIS